MFQFRGFPTYSYWFTVRSVILHHRCSHIRKSAGHSLFAAHRSLSQLVTSFFGSQCQGILHILFFAWTTLSKSTLSCCGLLPGSSFFSLELLCFHTCSLKTFSFFVWQNCFNFYPYGKTWFRFYRFLSFPLLCLSCMSHRFFKNLYDFSYSVFNEHSLNFC